MALEYSRSGAKVWAGEKIKGFYMCPISPVGNDLHIDEQALRDNIDALIDMGLDGLVVGGFFAEGWNLTPTQWVRFHEVVAEAGRARFHFGPLFLILAYTPPLKNWMWCRTSDLKVLRSSIRWCSYVPIMKYLTGSNI
ncbi:MAG: hypothetical protein JKY89_01770 [Immundisolibacteraceae bacterium]|nr:hypothetical protein [Immundisolibacteraceae bacterium]